MITFFDESLFSSQLFDKNTEEIVRKPNLLECKPNSTVSYKEMDELYLWPIEFTEK